MWVRKDQMTHSEMIGRESEMPSVSALLEQLYAREVGAEVQQALPWTLKAPPGFKV